MHQTPLFNTRGFGMAPMPPTDPNVIRSDVARLTGQNRAIYDRLRRGPATGRELAAIAQKYTSRISDIRDALAGSGWTIPEPVRGAGGVTTYRLEKA